MQKSFPSVLPTRVYPLSLQMHENSAQRKPAKHKKTSVVKFQSKARLLSVKRTTSKQRRDILASERGLQLIKIITPPVVNHLS